MNEQIPSREVKISVERIERYYVEHRAQFGTQAPWILAGPFDTKEEAISARNRFIRNQHKYKPNE